MLQCDIDLAFKKLAVRMRMLAMGKQERLQEEVTYQDCLPEGP